MGFNKRYLSKEKILSVYQTQGLPKLILFIENTDCLIFEDDFSEEISDIVLNYDFPILQEKISELIDESK
jgi:hypothetical protein